MDDGWLTPANMRHIEKRLQAVAEVLDRPFQLVNANLWAWVWSQQSRMIPVIIGAVDRFASMARQGKPMPWDDDTERTEVYFQDRVLGILSSEFDVYREIPGRHFSGKVLRIDAIVIPLDKAKWKDPDVAMGIEFKNPSYAGNAGSWLAQCVDYTNTSWDSFGYVHIFSCPSILEAYSGYDEVLDAHSIVSRIMGHFGIGELYFDRHTGLTFSLQDRRIWSQLKGTCSGQHWLIKRKWGSR